MTKQFCGRCEEEFTEENKRMEAGASISIGDAIHSCGIGGPKFSFSVYISLLGQRGDSPCICKNCIKSALSSLRFSDLCPN